MFSYKDKEVMFKIWHMESGKHWVIYTNGDTEGFPEGSVTSNYFAAQTSTILAQVAHHGGEE